MDTIYAVSSGRPPAAIAILRISGAGAFAAAGALCGRLPKPRYAALRTLRHPRSGVPLDRALTLCFPAPATATGEDLVELHVHGGRAVVDAVEAALAALPGMRPAQAGEFTRRALMNGVLDLTQAEGLGDLLAAETEDQRRAALLLSDGHLRRDTEAWRAVTIDLAGRIEALLDHADEDDVDEGALDDVRSEIGRLAETLAERLRGPHAELLHNGVRVVLAGPPNAGKSTLLNALCGRDAAIVTDIPGTTRDRIEVPVVQGGIAWLLTDTAGLRDDSDDPVEQVGIGRSRDAIASADMLLWLDDVEPAFPVPTLWIHPRMDLPGRGTVAPGRIGTSTTGGTTVAALWHHMVALAKPMLTGETARVLNRRQRECVSNAHTALNLAAAQHDSILVAEHLRVAVSAFDDLSGRSRTEQVLDAMFARFCIGK